jgi:hypothetical protein
VKGRQDEFFSFIFAFEVLARFYTGLTDLTCPPEKHLLILLAVTPVYSERFVRNSVSDGSSAVPRFRL